MTSQTQGALVLTQEIKDVVNGSLESDDPILLAVVIELDKRSAGCWGLGRR